MRERRLYHPLWTHLPALALVGFMIARFVAAMPLPASVPVHFTLTGAPDRWGSPWELFFTLIGISIVWLGISTLVDELWARQEDRKTFNWMALIDEATIGLMAGIFVHYGSFQQVQSVPGATTLVPWVLGSVLAAALLEHFRPHIAHERSYRPEDTSRLEMEIGSFVEEGKPWVYWETQNPAWMNWVLLGAIASMFCEAWRIYVEVPRAAIPMALLALVIIPLYGGLRVLVTPVRVQVRMGIFGIPLLRLWLSDLTSVEIHEFSPLKDFGGYGIRINRHMKAYFFRGNRGVLVTTNAGKKYLIGSDHPERLAAVLDVARKMAG